MKPTMKHTALKMFTLNQSTKFLLTLVIMLAALIPVAQPRPAFAAGDEIGYLWSLNFDFENSFDGKLTIKVGPWKDGDLVEVTQTSTATVPCAPVGAVVLDKGDAVFKGGYLQCTLDLATVVWNNHQLDVNDIDNYGSIVMQAKVNSSAPGAAPLFTHPNASYGLDVALNSSVTMKQELWNGAGLVQANFAGVAGNSWQNYTYRYFCLANGGACDAYSEVAGQTSGGPTGGQRVQFATGVTSFTIGSGGGATFKGRMAALAVDPGNSAH